MHQMHEDCVLSLAWSPDGSYLASGDTVGVVHIWRVPTWRPVLTYGGHKRFVRSEAWSLDGRLIASGGDYGDSTVQVWEAQTGKLRFVHAEQYRIFSICWSPIPDSMH